MTALSRGLASLLALILTLALFVSTATARTDATELTVDGTQFVIDAADGMEGFQREAVRVVEENWAHVVELSGAPAGETITIAIERDMNDWFEREGLPSRPPEWAAGLALPSRRAILLVQGVSDWQSTLVHEMAHVAVAIAANDGTVPRWFQEGYAVAVAEQWTLERATTMMRAGVFGNFYEFTELEDGFPPAASSADLAYAQSFHFVRFIRESHGDGIFRDVLMHMRGGLPWSDAYHEATGVPVAATAALWSRRVKSRYVWAPSIGGGFAWTLASVIFLLAWRRKKSSSRARMQTLTEQERTIFPNNDPDDITFG